MKVDNLSHQHTNVYELEGDLHLTNDVFNGTVDSTLRCRDIELYIEDKLQLNPLLLNEARQRLLNETPDTETWHEVVDKVLHEYSMESRGSDDRLRRLMRKLWGLT